VEGFHVIGGRSARAVSASSWGRLATVVVAAAVLAWPALQVAPALAAPSGAARASAGSGAASLDVVSCASAGNCAAVGHASAPGGRAQLAVLNQRGGRWGRAEQVRGLSALPGGEASASFDSVSCGRAGDCSAGGSYFDHASNIEAFVVSEKNWVWGKAEEVPGTAALNVGGNQDVGGANVQAVSCQSAGNCSASGYYGDGAGNQQLFVVNEKNGTWGTAEEIPGTAALNIVSAGISALSCASAGNCAAGGYYASHGIEAFVVSERNGTWGKAEAVPGINALRAGGSSSTDSASCPSAGNCVAIGHYLTSKRQPGIFVVSQKNGVWGRAKVIGGLAALPKGGAVVAGAGWLRCGPGGGCDAGGSYTDRSGTSGEFVVSEKNGTWGRVRELPLNLGKSAVIDSGSCGAVGNCSAGGYYIPRRRTYEVLVVSERHGTWTKAIELPGSGRLNAGGDGGINALSCGSAGNCSAIGSYETRSRLIEAFVVSEKNGTWGQAEEVAGLP
jgi:hypothetical protein